MGNVNHTNYFQLSIASPLTVDISVTYTSRFVNLFTKKSNY